MKKKLKRKSSRKFNSPKKCFFCESKIEPWYTDAEVLGRYLTERGKIIGSDRNGLCAKHQRHLTLAIKYARHLALLPFVQRD